MTFAKIYSKASKQISLAVDRRRIRFVFGVAKKKEKREEFKVDDKVGKLEKFYSTIKSRLKTD